MLSLSVRLLLAWLLGLLASLTDIRRPYTVHSAPAGALFT